MSAGDIDDTLAPEGQLEALCAANPIYNEYLIRAWHFIPIRTFFIPYGAGVSEDLERVYVSYDLQTIIDGIETVECVLRHETAEGGARVYCDPQIGFDYAKDSRGHWLGNRAEHDRVLELLRRPDAWEIYGEIIDAQVVLEERTKFADKPVPLDLALYPYDERFRDMIREAQVNDRSAEEWEKLNAN